MKIRREPITPTRRRATERLVQNFLGLNTTAPYTQMKDSVSPNFYNCRLYARNSTDRRVAVGTRKGITPHGLVARSQLVLTDA